MARYIFFYTFLQLFVSWQCAYGAEADTLAVEEPAATRFCARQLIAPGALVATGSIVAATDFGHHLQREIKSGMADLRGDHYFHADDYVQYAPVVAYAGMGLCGVRCRNDIRRRLLAGATAYLAMAVMTNGAKYTVRERRPDSSTRNSFPSGHTATAFTGAELVRREYGLGLGLAAYGVASGVAVLRLYNERHWLGDVLCGAGIGILSANIGYWMLPVYERWFHIGPSSSFQVAAMPDLGTDHFGIAATIVL